MSYSLGIGARQEVTMDRLVKAAAAARRCVDMYSPIDASDLTGEETRQFELSLCYLGLIEKFYVSDGVAEAASMAVDPKVAADPVARSGAYATLLSRVTKWRSTRLWKRG